MINTGNEEQAIGPCKHPFVKDECTIFKCQSDIYPFYFVFSHRELTDREVADLVCEELEGEEEDEKCEEDGEEEGN